MSKQKFRLCDVQDSDSMWLSTHPSHHTQLLRHSIPTVCTYGMRQKTLPSPFNGTEQIILFPFNNISLIVHDPFPIRSRSVRIFYPF